MPTLAVLDPGLSSIQGLGRYGSQRYGIAPGGAMDRFALAESNALTGQPAGAAAIEIGPNPARFRVLGGTIRVAFAGAERTVYIDDRPVKLGQSYLAHAGEIVSVRGARGGRYTYFSVQGGLQGRDMAHGPYTEREPAVMEHRNSWVLSSADGIQVLPAANTKIERQLKLSKSDNRPIRVVLGPQIEYFTTDAMESFLSAAWAISHASNRMAYFLDGPAVVASEGFDIVSDGTVTGNIQISGRGQPVAILRDRGTVGGYPKIATIITADIGRFCQLPAGSSVSFSAVSILEAQVLAKAMAFELSNLKPKVEQVGRIEPISAGALLSYNIAGDACNPLDWPMA